MNKQRDAYRPAEHASSSAELVLRLGIFLLENSCEVFLGSICVALLFMAAPFGIEPIAAHAEGLSGAPSPRLFAIQSVDTMKDSRDRARTAASDPAYDAEISREMALIAGTGATHVAIDVPYDDEFLPLMKRWVGEARAHHLKIWFRGNLAGWEGWFGYPKIGREEHVKGVERFILNDPDLFQDGDIMSACPECENGGPGDPRQTGDVPGYRAFLENEFDVFSGDFAKIGKDVGLVSSMNWDVAKLVMDPPTASALGGVVAIDDYATSSVRIESDIVSLHGSSGAEIVLGEFGGPIPGLNGEMDDAGQAKLVAGLLDAAFRHADVVSGANYWTLRYGSTALVRDDLSRKPAIQTVADYYAAPSISGIVRDLRGRAIEGKALRAELAASTSQERAAYPFRTGSDGSYRIFVPGPWQDKTLSVLVADPAAAYATTTLADAFQRLQSPQPTDIAMALTYRSLFERFLAYLRLRPLL